MGNKCPLCKIYSVTIAYAKTNFGENFNQIEIKRATESPFIKTEKKRKVLHDSTPKPLSHGKNPARQQPGWYQINSALTVEACRLQLSLLDLSDVFSLKSRVCSKTNLSLIPIILSQR